MGLFCLVYAIHNVRYLNRKERRYRKLAVLGEKKQALLRGLLRSEPFRKNILYQISYQLSTKWSFRLLKNRCKYTELGRGISRIYHISRSVFRSSASFAGFFAVRRCSW